jgi:hypothetical protein
MVVASKRIEALASAFRAENEALLALVTTVDAMLVVYAAAMRRHHPSNALLR